MARRELQDGMGFPFQIHNEAKGEKYGKLVNEFRNQYTSFYRMKSSNKSKADKFNRDEILKSLLASFKIEGIDISPQITTATLKKVELKLGKQNR